MSFTTAATALPKLVLRALRRAPGLLWRALKRTPRALWLGVRRTPRVLWLGVKGTGRGLRAAWRGLRAPAGRLSVQVAFTVLALAGALTAGWLVVPSAGPAWSFGTEPTPEAAETPLALSPEGAIAEAPAAGLPAETGTIGDILAPTQTPTESPTSAAATPGGLETWAANLSDLGIPQRALVAYGRGELVSAAQNPGCNLSWTTLAGIGATETTHGTIDGNQIQADGTTLTQIIGPIHGEWGPMQFLPSTWEHWKADGDGDGKSDPHDIDDAVTAAANYLCHDNRDMSRPDGWYAALWSYNPRDDYVKKVFDRADEYGRKSTA
ncbi:lytic murein transglycosylase [Glycomyces sp. NPDC048151]|uniref:lytic murein transglycosylase n=1 Tax=Glycomyces sp. NPDC048151 TaxID=3364002 RepID=UPI003715BBBA